MQILQNSTQINQGSVNFNSWSQTYLQITWAPECRALVDFVLPEDCYVQNNKQRPPQKKQKKHKTKQKKQQTQKTKKHKKPHNNKKPPKNKTKQNKKQNRKQTKQNKTKTNTKTYVLYISPLLRSFNNLVSWLCTSKRIHSPLYQHLLGQNF